MKENRVYFLLHIWSIDFMNFRLIFVHHLFVGGTKAQIYGQNIFEYQNKIKKCFKDKNLCCALPTTLWINKYANNAKSKLENNNEPKLLAVINTNSLVFNHVNTSQHFPQLFSGCLYVSNYHIFAVNIIL